MLFNLDEIMINTGGTFFYKKNDGIFNNKYNLCFSKDKINNDSIYFSINDSSSKKEFDNTAKGFILNENSVLSAEFNKETIMKNNPDFIFMINDTNTVLKNLAAHKRAKINSKIIMISGEIEIDECINKIKKLFNQTKIIETKINPYADFLESDENIDAFIIKCDDYNLNLKEFAIYFAPDFCIVTPLDPKKGIYGRISSTASAICKIAYPFDISKKVLSHDSIFYRSSLEKIKKGVIFSDSVNDEKTLLSFFKPVD